MQVKYRDFTVFVFFIYDSIISSHIIAESSVVLAKYFPFSQLHVAEFET